MNAKPEFHKHFYGLFPRIRIHRIYTYTLQPILIGYRIKERTNFAMFDAYSSQRVIV